LVREGVVRIARRYKLDPSVFVVDVPEELRVTSDATALEVVVTNLLDNAVKYSEREVQVNIVARTVEGNFLELHFVDSGIGIPQKSLKKIFDRFYRVPAERVNSRRGTGLGLFVVASLIKSLGGKVKASSPGENRGATLEVLLPMEAQEV
jgi:K+-sensing histidine kinase KdpD